MYALQPNMVSVYGPRCVSGGLGAVVSRQKIYQRWAILYTGNDLTPDYLMGNTATGMTTLFKTRAKARQDKAMIEYNAMIARRRDLREYPHYWRAKRPVKVLVTIERVS